MPTNSWGTSADDPTDGGTVVWGGTGSPGTPAASTWTNTAVSHYLKLTNFGFSISTPPAGSGVQTITAALAFNITVGGGTFGVKDNSVKLLVGGAFAGNQQSIGAVWGSVANNYPNDTSDLNWGPLTDYTQVNAANFGIAVQGIGTSLSAGGTATLTAATITVTIGLLDWTLDASAAQTTQQVVNLRRRAAHPAPVPYRCAAMRGPVFRQTRTLRFATPLPLPLFRAAA